MRIGCHDTAPGPPAPGFHPPAGDAKLVPFSGRPDHFSLLAHARASSACVGKPARRAEGRMPGVKKSNQKKGPPDDAPSVLLALQVRVRVTEFFDRTSLSCRKTGRIPAATLRAFLHPPAASYGDPGGRARAASKSRATNHAGRLSFCRSALVRDQPTERWIRALRSRTSALLQGDMQPGADQLSVGAHPVRDKPTERYTAAWLSRTGCAPTDKRARQVDGARPKADAQRGFALSPLRRGALRCSRIACRTIATLPIPSIDRRPYPTRRYELLIYRPFSLGYFRREASPVGSLGPAREK